MLTCVYHEQPVKLLYWPLLGLSRLGLFHLSVEFIESYNHRTVWLGRNLKDHLVPTLLPWAGTPSTRSDCSKPRPTWP